MKEFKNASLKAVLLFLVFFLDGQVSQLITDLNGGGVFFTSHLLLLLLFFYNMNTQGLFLGPLSVVLGFFYDNYYLNGFGIAIFLVPLSLLVIIKLKNSFPDNFFSDLLLISFILFGYDLASYGLASLYGQTGFPTEVFLLTNAIPSLLLNSFIFCIFYFLRRKGVIKGF